MILRSVVLFEHPIQRFVLARHLNSGRTWLPALFSSWSLGRVTNEIVNVLAVETYVQQSVSPYLVFLLFLDSSYISLS